jgi:GNAT superfamily N-acetyltransferase
MRQFDDLGFRRATDADVPAMAACRSTDPSVHPADTRMAAYFRGEHHPQQALSDRVGFVALAGDAVVGYIAGHRTTRHGCDGEVQYLFVATAYRRRGVATSLLGLLAAWFERQSAHKVCVCIDRDSPAAQPFYDSVGAVPIKRLWRVWDNIAVCADREGERGNSLAD